jgi:hypothetical protein
MSLPSVTGVARLDPSRRERIEALARQIETPHMRTVYGRQVQVEPTFCPAVIGDGSHLLVVTALRTAPAYHAILVDSSWVRPAASLLVRCGLEADLDDADRRDLLAGTLADYCGDGDLWHEEHGEEHVTPPGLFARDTGFTWGVEPLGADGMLADGG